jgi:hypothetical protein
MYENVCGNSVDRIVDISLTVHSRTILKIVKSMCNGIKKSKCTQMKCHANVNSTPLTQLPHKFSYGWWTKKTGTLKISYICTSF